MLNPFLTGKPIYDTEGLSLHKRIGKNWMVDSTSKEKVELIFSTRYKLAYSEFSFVEVYHQIYVRKSCFMALLARRCKTKFPTLYLTIYLPKWIF